MSNISHCKHNFYFDNCRICFPQPMRELSDEEILKMAADKFHYSEYKLVIDFARAVLKKASKK